MNECIHHQRRNVSTGLAWAAAPVLGLADAAGASDGGMGLFGDLGQGLFTIAIFLVLLAVLRRWAWRPMLEQLRFRQEAIDRQIQQAQEHRTQAEGLLADYRKKLDAAESEAHTVLEESRRQAVTAREEVLAEARKEGRKTIDLARQEIDAARRQAMKELRLAAVELSVELTEQAIRRRLDAPERQRLLDEALHDVGERLKG